MIRQRDYLYVSTGIPVRKGLPAAKAAADLTSSLSCSKNPRTCRNKSCCSLRSLQVNTGVYKGSDHLHKTSDLSDT